MGRDARRNTAGTGKTPGASDAGADGYEIGKANQMGDRIPHVVIVGGGFGGLAAAKALKNAPAHVTLIDRSNHHLFQPLLYQVATSVLTPGQIGSAIRNILRKQRSTTVVLGEVTGLDVEKRCVL